MSVEASERRRSTVALRGLVFLIVLLLATAVIVAQQLGAGAYVAELGATDPEEARHFVTALMVADHAAAGFPAPGAFAADYGLAAPQALPLSRLTLFHVLTGGWLLLLTPTTPAALLLPAALAALLVVSAGWATAWSVGVLPAVAVGFVLAALPLLREASLVLGLDLPLALSALLSALAFGRCMRRGTTASAALFAAAGAISVLVAPAGAVVLLLPPLAALMAGRLDLMRRARVLVPLAALAVLALAVALAAGRLPPVVTAQGPEQVWQTLRAAFGTLPLALAAAGLVFTVVDGWRKAAGTHGEAQALAPVAALVPAFTLAFWLGVGRGVPIDAIVLLAPVAMLAAFGAMRLTGLLVSGWGTIRELAVALLLLLAAMPGLLQQVRKGPIGMDAAAEAFLARDAAPPVIVVAGDARGAAALGAAIAQRDRARRSFVVEADRLPTATPEELLAAFDAIGAAALAVEARETGATPASRAAQATVAAFPDRFRAIGTFPRADGRGEVVLHAVSRAVPPPSDPVPVLRRLTAPSQP
ncbi:hypothetical protein K9U40_18840 [Xanthobacter autotrophicus]|uniref:hypothetical protein n=1 Tax=Xanthobacter TaxID=279 RepID=UPI0024AB157E|nr:hypothetical protein [Xanthobacter autotrophicus]MDI4666364.1 hypothetical protein [Xanthobacter autotrophicus]